MADSKPYIGFNNSGIINLEDNKTGLQMLDKLSRLQDERRIKPLDQFDNIIYPHRYLYDSYNLLIGDTYFMIPPEFIAVTSEATSQSIVTLRQENTQKMKSGYHKRTIMIDLVFNGIEQLNGYKVNGPEGIYYVDGLRQLLAQFKCTPFLPITNELINGMYGIFTVALQSITMHTMPGYPNAMGAHITLQEVNMFPYIQMPDVAFKYMIDWDLFRFYYQRLLTENHTYKKLQSLPANKEHNRFKLSILDESVFSSQEATKYNLLQIICDKKIVKTTETGDFDTTNYTTWVNSDTDNVTISAFQCNYANILTNIQLSDSGSPTVQFMGGMDTIYNITFETTDYTVVQSLEQCQITNDTLVRGNRKLNSLGFVKLESEFVEFTGSLFVMIENVMTNTVPGFPGLYSVQMQCVAYDIAQSEREDLKGFLPFECNEDGRCGKYEKAKYDNNGNLIKKGGFVSDHAHTEQAIDQSMDGLLIKIKQDAYAEWKLRTNMEVYPDLRLPTYDEVDTVITKIRNFRENNSLSQLPYSKYPKSPTYMLHGLSLDNEAAFEFENKSNSIIDVNTIDDSVNQYNGFVDPDFYVFYPTSYESFMIEDENCYSAYSPKTRNSVTKTKTVTKAPSFDGESGDPRLIEQFIKLAEKYIGFTYKLGFYGNYDSDGKQKFDCIGFIYYLLKSIGVMPANTVYGGITYHMNNYGKSLYTEIPWGEMQRGDLLVQLNDNGGNEHIVIYKGDNKIIHASNSNPYPKGGVKEGNLYFSNGKCFRPKAFAQNINNNGNSSYNSVNQIIQQDLGNWSPMTIEEMNNWISSKAPSDSPFIGQGEVFLQAANESGLDPRYILAHSALESAWGKSTIAHDKNNYFGIGAFDSSPYESAYTFDAGLAAGIIDGAKWISRNYYNNSNYNQKTLYSMRHNNGVHQYATDPKWHTKIASIMVEAPTSSISNTEYVFTQEEFDSICRVIMAETKGESDNAEKALAQVIYDRLTHPSKKFGGLSNILNGGVNEFPAPYEGMLNSTIEDNVKAVFCKNDKYWNDYQAWYFLTPSDNNATFKDRDNNYDRLGEVDMHTFWGKESKGSDVKYTIIDGDGTSSASSNNYSYSETTTHEATTISAIKKFGQPAYIKTDAVMYDNNWFPWTNTEGKISQEELNSTENTFNTSFCDEVQYSGRGKLVRAFPTYLFCILDDQAQWYDGRKLWTNYYIHRSVVDIAVHATNDMPVETATITVTNSYHNLDRIQGGLSSYTLSEDDGYNAFQQWWYSWSGVMPSFGPKLTDKLIELHQVIYDQAKLREGARIHLRMGYGSDPLSLAPVMNGHISDVTLGDQITMVVTSDGHELIQHITSANERDINAGWLGLFGLGEDQESSNIIADIICARNSWVTHLMGSTFEGSKYSIEHFGLYFNKTVMGTLKDKILGNVSEDANSAAETGEQIGTELGEALEESLDEVLGIDLPDMPFISDITSAIGSSVGGVLGTIGSVVSGTGELVGDVVSDIWDGNQENYDLLKNIYKANYKRQHYVYTTTEIGDGNEPNIVFNKYNMTPWDVFQICTQQVPEYIVKPSYHQFDSRLYFGLPFWMEKYRYDYLNGVVYEECKTAAQAHFIDSMDCIIDNQIRVTSKFSNTNVKVMYTRGEDLVSTKLIHSDDSIDFSKQKTTILDTPITQDALGPDAIYELLQYDIGEESARRVGISNLLYGWQQQYQGQLLLMGHPGLKPHDYMMINDTFANLYGLALVREVTHSFNTNTGFTTSVVPGMIGFCTDENSGLIQTSQNYLMLLNCFSSYTQIRKNLRNNYEKNISVVAELEIMQNKLNTAINELETAVHNQNIYNGLSTSTSIVADIASIRSIYSAGKNVFSFTKNLYDMAKAGKIVNTFLNGYETASKVYKGYKAISTAGKGIKTTLAAIKAGTIATGTAAGGVPGLVIAVVWVAVDILLDELFEWLSNRNVCTLLPLWWEGYPFVSGTNDGEKILLMDNNANATEENTREDGKDVTSQDSMTLDVDTRDQSTEF